MCLRGAQKGITASVKTSLGRAIGRSAPEAPSESYFALVNSGTGRSYLFQVRLRAHVCACLCVCPGEGAGDLRCRWARWARMAAFAGA